jgi:hypothetical protein
MILTPIKDFIVEKVVKAGITWVLGMLNPAGALIKIVQALISVVQWIMERGAALMDFVGTVVDAVSDIAAGGLGGVPAKIEAALGRAVPLVISFLAGLLGLGGISDMIKSTFDKVRKPVMNVVHAVVGAAVKGAKSLIKGIKGMFGKKKEKGEGPDERTNEGKAKDLDKGVKEGEGLIGQGLGEAEVKAKLPGIQAKYGLKRLSLVVDSQALDHETVHVVGEVNPTEVGGPHQISLAAPEVPPVSVELSVASKPPVGVVVMDDELKREVIGYYRRLIGGSSDKDRIKDYKQAIDRIETGARPKWWESEAAIRVFYPGKEIVYYRGETGRYIYDAKLGRSRPQSGSTVPDIVMSGALIEIKNYLLSGINAMIIRLKKQLISRARQGPSNVKGQAIVIDARGQIASLEMLAEIRSTVLDEVNAALAKEGLPTLPPNRVAVLTYPSDRPVKS